MMANPFGTGAIAIVGLYLCVMIGLGIAARRVQRQSTLSEFYLANRDLGTFVLLLTMYATQYSGNSLLGVPGETYRVGFLWVMSVTYMTSIIAAYLLFAPHLFRASRRCGFVTPGDWIDHRFRSPALSLVANLLLLLVICNFLLAQLLAMGHVVMTLSGHELPFWAGVVGLGLVVVLYETVGGMRAVAWTDCAQGALLLIGLTGILAAILPGLDRLEDTTLWIFAHDPAKAAVPDGAALRTWISTLLLVTFSAPVYPQSIQRLFSAKNARALRRSLSIMAFMPFVTVLPMFLLGILSLPHLPGLEGTAADQVMPALLRMWAGESSWLYVTTLLVLTGTVAAIMSTADSVLLSLSSIIAKDLLGKVWLQNASSESLANIGKIISWLVMLVLILFALSPRISLWGLIELKLEILIQVAPLFFLGSLWTAVTARSALIGLLVGTALAASLTLSGHGKIAGWHAGLLSAAVNLAIVISWSLLEQKFQRNDAR